MQRSLLARALAVVCGASGIAAAHAEMDIHVADCGIHSDYGLTVTADHLRFHRSSGTPSDIVIAHGSLRIDGKPVAVDGADRQRLLDIEHGVRSAMPEVKAIAHDAIAVAIDAVTEVSAAFARDPEAARSSAERLARIGRDLDQRIAATDSFNDWSEADIDRVAESAVGTLASEIIGNVAGQAISVALSGDQKAAAELEARADGIEKSVERAVERRSKALEQRTESLCPRLHALADAASSLDVRLADGRRIELARIKP